MRERRVELMRFSLARDLAPALAGNPQACRQTSYRQDLSRGDEANVDNSQPTEKSECELSVGLRWFAGLGIVGRLA